MKKSLAVTLLLAFAATSSYAQSRGHHSGGGHGGGHGYGGGHGGGYGGGGHAVPRGYAGGGYSGAAARHPSPGGGYSHGYYGGHGHSGGHGYYGGHGHYGGYYGHGYGYGYGRYYRGYPYYGYPYYGYNYGYYPWSYGLGLGVGLYYGSGYADTGYRAPEVAEYPSESRRDEPAEYVERGQPRNEDGAETAELQLVVAPDDASVYVDDEFRGIASGLVSVRLTAGRHRVEVVRPGYAVAQREVDVGRGATARLQINLERR